MSGFGFFDRFRIPTYDDPEQIQCGRVGIDAEKCTGCGLCTGACPVDTLIVKDKQARMREGAENMCAFCGDCAAICPEGAITLKSPYTFTGFFKTIDRGQASPPRL